MGATTLYHPVSLYVIRGSALQCGFVLGRVTQVWANQTKQQARYRCEIKSMPKFLWSRDPETVRLALNQCYSDDIEVQTMFYSAGVYAAYLHVSLDPNPEQMAISDEAYVFENTAR